MLWVLIGSALVRCFQRRFSLSCKEKNIHFLAVEKKQTNKKQHHYLELCLGAYHFACWVKISANNILKHFFLFFLENGIWHFMQIVSLGDNLHEVSNLIFWEK